MNLFIYRIICFLSELIYVHVCSEYIYHISRNNQFHFLKYSV